MKLRRSPFAALQAAADARHGEADALARRVREAVDEYERAPSPARHRAVAEAVGRLTCAVDPRRETKTAQKWTRIFRL